MLIYREVTPAKSSQLHIINWEEKGGPSTDHLGFLKTWKPHKVWDVAIWGHKVRSAGLFPGAQTRGRGFFLLHDACSRTP